MGRLFTCSSILSFKKPDEHPLPDKGRGRDAHQDIDTIRMVQEVTLPHERIWYDPNRAWTVDDAIPIFLPCAMVFDKM